MRGGMAIAFYVTTRFGRNPSHDTLQSESELFFHFCCSQIYEIRRRNHEYDKAKQYGMAGPSEMASPNQNNGTTEAYTIRAQTGVSQKIVFFAEMFYATQTPFQTGVVLKFNSKQPAIPSLFLPAWLPNLPLSGI